ncbi:hypothetical protein HDU83_009125 [Entophlyctis luteolus]|nr:hypothetical protein HDU83_009125 [Entophlyctis luteolus]
MTVGSVFTQTFTRPSWSPETGLPDLTGKVAIVTGASGGLGKETALQLALKGAHVFCVGRSAEKTQAAISDILSKSPGGKVEFLQADFMDLASVDAAADAFIERKLPLHILVNNAGIMESPWAVSKQGLESQFATNHFAHVVFTVKLLPVIVSSQPSRIVVLSSITHFAYVPPGRGINYDDPSLTEKEHYNAFSRYGETKLANLHFARELQARLDMKYGPDNKIYVNAVHPGLVRTELLRDVPKSAVLSLQPLLISASHGALTQLYVAAATDIEDKNFKGQYFVPYCRTSNPSAAAQDKLQAVKTWEWTEKGNMKFQVLNIDSKWQFLSNLRSPSAQFRMTLGSLLAQTFTRPTWSPATGLPDLTGKVALVTGASSGLGKETALQLALKGAHVFCVGRSAEKTQAAIDDIVTKSTNSNVEFLQADFMDLESVEAAADVFIARKLPLHILVNNAGTMGPWAASAQGIESQFATNHFAHVVLTAKLLPVLLASQPARIVVISSMSHFANLPFGRGILYDDPSITENVNYNSVFRYGETKLANVHFARELQARLDAKYGQDHKLYVNAVHPGIVKTKFIGLMPKAASIGTLPFQISIEHGALTQVYVAGSADIEKQNVKGKYFVPFCQQGEPSAKAQDKDEAVKTWEWSERMLQTRLRREWAFGV